MMTLNDALTDVADMAYELTAYPGGLAGFAYSIDHLDQMHAERFREAAKRIAVGALDAGMSDNEIAQIHAALAFVCSVDEYAAKEVAGRFLSLVRRLRVTRAIARHPRAGRFDGLVRAIERGRFTKEQWTLAAKLAVEAA